MWYLDWPHYICRSVRPIFHYPKILLNNLNTMWWMNHVLGHYFMDECQRFSNVKWYKDNIYGPVILPYNFNTISWLNVILGVSILCDPNINLIIYVGPCDLYFMVHWFCLLSWRPLLHEHHYTKVIGSIWHHAVYHVNCISLFSNFAIWLHGHVMYECHTLHIGFRWHQHCPPNKCR